MPKYNHAFSFGFACADSKYEDPYYALIHEKDKIIGALLARVQELVTNTTEFREACKPYDTYEEVKNQL